MSKIGLAGKISKSNYEKVEQFQKERKIPTKSQTLDYILTDYFKFTDKRRVTVRLPQNFKGGNAILPGQRDKKTKINKKKKESEEKI